MWLNSAYANTSIANPLKVNAFGFTIITSSIHYGGSQRLVRNGGGV